MELIIGRLVFDYENGMYNAYYTTNPESDKRVLIAALTGSIASMPKHRQAFIDMVKAAMAEVIEQVSGASVVYPSERNK